VHKVGRKTGQPVEVVIGEVEASNTPTIRRLTPSRRHQLSPIAPCRPIDRHMTGNNKCKCWWPEKSNWEDRVEKNGLNGLSWSPASRC
jgi:hypothetical protein